MKRFYLSKPVILLALLTGWSIGANAQAVTMNYSFTGAVQTYTVLPGVFSVNVVATGASGGTGGSGTSQRGGNGGRVSAVMTTTPGQILYIYVGGAGGNGYNVSNNPSVTIGGFNGGGSAPYGYYVGGGGGASDVRTAAGDLTRRVVVAGGGGGAGYCCSTTTPFRGGDGGTLTGETGFYSNQNAYSSYACYIGAGGSQSAGGSAATCVSGSAATPGGFGVGGNGVTSYYGGAGGGGYYGGGGGYYGGGGGGSSYTDPVYVNPSSVTHTLGAGAAGANGTIAMNGICTPPTAGAITGFPANGICVGNVVQVTNPTGSTGGVWSSGTTAVATITNLGFVVGVSPGTATISYSVTYACGTPQLATYLVTVNPTPAINAPSPVCAGSSVFLSGFSTPPSSPGTWSSSNVFQATINSTTGQLTGVAPGNPRITYTQSTGCYATAIATVNATPASITGPAGVCFGQTTTLFDGSVGGVWTSDNSALANLASSSVGIISGQNVGATTISYTLPSTGCYVTVPFSVYSLPSAFGVSTNPASGHFCQGGTGVDVLTSGSDANASYQLYRNTVAVGGPLPGSSSSGPVAYNFISTPGDYTVIATNTNGCVSTSLNNTPVVIDSLPRRIFTINSGGSYCNGGNGAQITLSGSDPNISYQLYGPSGFISSLIGTGGTLDFNNQMLPTGAVYGSYYITAVDPLTISGSFPGCIDTMPGTAVITVNPLPALQNVTTKNAVTSVAGEGFCQGDPGVRIGVDFGVIGVDYKLYFGSSTTPIATATGSNASLDFGAAFNSIGSYTVIATNSATQCQETMNGFPSLYYSHVPDPHVVQGGGHFCTNDTGVHVKLDLSDAGVNYQLMRGSTVVGSALAGTGLGDELDFGLQTISGTYKVIGKEVLTGCSTTMTGNILVQADALPAVHNVTVTNGGNFCTGSAGQQIGVDQSETGISYEVFMGTGTSVGSANGNNNPLSIGTYSVAGNYTVVATDMVLATGCKSAMTGVATLTENLLPDPYALSGGGAYCTGTNGVHIGMAYSSIGVDYQLIKSGVDEGLPVGGSSSSLDFGTIYDGGVYTVRATNSATGCSSIMPGSTTVTVQTSPAAYTVISNGSTFCAGDAGIEVSVSTSDLNVNYQLYNGTTMVGGLVSGTGTELLLSQVTAPGSYTIKATDALNACVTDMLSSVSVVVSPVPVIYTVSGDGSYCAGGTGVHILQNNSNAGISYQLIDINTNMPFDMAVTSTGGALDFGAKMAAGTYMVEATDLLTSCKSMMNGSATILIDPIPGDHTVTGGGDYCAGGTGFSISMTGSDAGISYQLYNGTAMAGGSVTGDGSNQNFGIHTAAGTYKIVATDEATGCSATMSNTPVINILPLPDQYTVFGGGAFCAGTASSVHVNLGGSTLGVNYQLMNGATPVGIPVAATGSYIDFGIQTMAGNYSVVATDASGVCSASMTGVATVMINPLPDAFMVTGGGNYCSGGTGSVIGISGSTAGVTYQLWNGSTLMSTIAGAGIVRNFPPQTVPGTYTVRAVNMATTCSNNMTGSTAVGITPSVIPSVIASSGIGDTVCAGAVNTFTAMSVNGGTAPVYQWKVNGVFSGAGSTYSYVPANGDIVTVSMTSNEVCPVPAIVSNTHMMTVRTYETPVVTISSAPGDVVCKGTAVTYSSAPVFGGTAPTYTWLKNSVVVGTGATYTTVPVNGDIIIFLMGSNFPCRLMDSVYSNNIYMQVDSPMTPVISIVASPGTSISTGQSDTLRAVVDYAGASPMYQWYQNGLAIPGATHATYISNNFANKDSISCRVTTNTACAPNTSFNSVIMSVRNVGVNQVSSAGNVVVSPNPNKGSFMIKGTLGSSDEEVSLELSNMLGQVVYRSKAMTHNGSINEQVQVNGNIASGMYLLNIRSESEHAVFHIVIEQ